MGVRALAIDPGMSTGMAAYLDTGVIWTTTVAARDGDMSDIIDTVLGAHPRLIIIESFLTRGLISKYGLETIKLVGAVECLQHLGRVGRVGEFRLKFDLIQRTPSQRIVRVPEAIRYMQERRASTGLKHSDHEIAALAHLFGWMRQEGIPYGHTNNTSALPTTPV